MTDLARSTVLVTGASGILGDALLRSSRFAGSRGVVHVHDSEHDVVRADLRDRAQVERVLDEVNPDVVVHTVALTDVDGCERDGAAAFATNVETTSHLAEALRARSEDGLLVYISSDQVYSGQGPHTEDRPAPVNVYGTTKFTGELAAQQAGRSLALRTNFFGQSPVRPSFTDWIADAAREGRPIRLDSRAVFSPLHLDHLVDVIADAIEAGLAGTFNAGARDAVSKVEFAREVAARSAPRGERFVEPFAEDVPGRAVRPLHLALDVTRLERALARPMPTVRQGLDRLSDTREGARRGT